MARQLARGGERSVDVARHSEHGTPTVADEHTVLIRDARRRCSSTRSRRLTATVYQPTI
jgi:hypothetical protein